MSIQYGPIRTWPGKLRSQPQRRRATFKSSYNGTIRLLERELRVISAASPVIQLAIPENYWRIDGRPYANAPTIHPGVIVSFTKDVKTSLGRQRVPLSFPCDTFTTFESNLRAIALALEALRRVDRYGVTQNAEQYTGFRALPPPGPTDQAIVTIDDAAKFITEHDGLDDNYESIIEHEGVYRECYRRAAAKLHPDTNNGVQRPEWNTLQAAKSLLDDLHTKPMPAGVSA